MDIRIAIAGNPNCGKTTLFNALTGSNQFVGNWPGVTVEKKEGRLKGRDDVVVIDLPGVYSLSPYTLEEVVARNYLVDERPDAILDDMVAGLEPTDRYLRIADRREAIRTAVMLAAAGDVILIAGKGHETYQEIEGVKHHFDDREQVREAFDTLRKKAN